MKPMDRRIFGTACVALSLLAFDTAAAPHAPADALTDETLSDEDRPPGDTPDHVGGEMLCARPR